MSEKTLKEILSPYTLKRLEEWTGKKAIGQYSPFIAARWIGELRYLNGFLLHPKVGERSYVAVYKALAPHLGGDIDNVICGGLFTRKPFCEKDDDLF